MDIRNDIVMKRDIEYIPRTMCIIGIIACIFAVPAIYEAPIDLVTGIKGRMNEEEISKIDDNTMIRHLSRMMLMQKDGTISLKEIFHFVIKNPIE